MKPVSVAWLTILAVLLSACGGAHPSAPAPATVGAIGVRLRQIGFAGSTRGYRVFSPSAPTTGSGLALVVVLGGVGDSSESMANATQFDVLAATDNFIVAYAESAGPSWDAGFCCAGPASNAIDDVGFLNHLLDGLEHEYRIDPARVYAVGVSAGAMMAYRWACADAGRIAGVGSVAGTMLLDTCHPSEPVSIIEIHGTADPLVPFAGGAIAPSGVATQPSPSSAALVQRWASLDACPSAASTQTQAIVTTTTWTGCAASAGVRLIAVTGGGHTWFSSGFGAVDGALDASHAIWDYLGSHTRAR